MITPHEVATAIKNAPPHIAYYGLRIDEGKPVEKVGDYMPHTRVWENGEPTNNMLNGTSTLGLGEAPTVKDIENAILGLDYYRGPGHTYGDTISLVGAPYREHGMDAGEHILRKGIALGIWPPHDK